MWNRGSPDSHTSSSPPMVIVTIMLKVFMTRLKWERTAPFGRPVVPEVYMMNAGSDSGTSTPGGLYVPAADEAGQGLGSAVLDDVDDLVGDQAEVDWHDDGAQAAPRQVRLHHLPAVGHEHRHPVTLLHSAVT